MATLRIGLTGGIGSGKSTVARMLVGCGATLVDADAIARQVTASGGAAVKEIASQFGDDVITADGALDRDRMRQLAFNDPAARLRLEAIVHPLVGQETLRQAGQAVKAGSPCLVFDIPLLVESGRWRLTAARPPRSPGSWRAKRGAVAGRATWSKKSWPAKPAVPSGWRPLISAFVTTVCLCRPWGCWFGSWQLASGYDVRKISSLKPTKIAL